MRAERLSEEHVNPEWRVMRDRLVNHVRRFVPDGWSRSIGTFARMPNVLPADLDVFAGQARAGTLETFLTEKYRSVPYGMHIAHAIVAFYEQEHPRD